MESGITIELFGIPRHRAGRPEVQVPAGTIRDVLLSLQQACPALKDLRRDNGGLAPQYLLSVDGRSFLGDLNQTLVPGSRLILLSADVGG